jgi:hypothetical protein
MGHSTSSPPEGRPWIEGSVRIFESEGNTSNYIVVSFPDIPKLLEELARYCDATVAWGAHREP